MDKINFIQEDSIQQYRQLRSWYYIFLATLACLFLLISSIQLPALFNWYHLHTKYNKKKQDKLLFDHMQEQYKQAQERYDFLEKEINRIAQLKTVPVDHPFFLCAQAQKAIPALHIESCTYTHQKLEFICQCAQYAPIEEMLSFLKEHNNIKKAFVTKLHNTNKMFHVTLQAVYKPS